MATVEVTKSKAWGVGAVLVLVVIILALYGVAKDLTNPSKDGEIKKLTSVLSDAVEKITATNKTLDGVDGAVKKFPQQLKEAISDHESRLHQRKPAITKRHHLGQRNPPTIDPQKLIVSAIDGCAKMGGVLRSHAGKFECEMKPLPRRELKQEVRVEAPLSSPAPLQEGADCDAGKGHRGMLKIVDGSSRCVWEAIQPPVPQTRREPAPVRETAYYREPLREVYYEDAPQQQEASSGGSSWLPWVAAAAVLGGIIYSNRSRGNPPVTRVGGPVNPAPLGGPINPIP